MVVNADYADYADFLNTKKDKGLNADYTDWTDYLNIVLGGMGKRWKKVPDTVSFSRIWTN